MRVVIVDDHVMFREAIARIFERDLGCKVVGEASDGDAALKLVAKAKPDLVVLDLYLPGHDGLTVSALMRSQQPDLPVILISAHCTDYALWRIHRAGVRAFVDKGADMPETLKKAIGALRNGGTYYSRSYQEAMRARTRDPKHFTKILSERECGVLELIGTSMSNREIAQRINITPATAQTHRSRIMRKLGIANSAKLMLYAIAHGFSRIVTLRNDKPVDW